jgi:iron complex outermembrane receptor protein
MLYATYSRGFKSGGLNLPAFAFVDTVDPEVLDDYEIGWKTQFGNIRWNGAAFYYDYKDLQISITDQTTGGTRIKNAAAAKVKGIESDITWAPSSQFEFGLGGSYLDTKYKNFIGDAYITCGNVPALDDSVSGKAAAIASCTGQGGLGLALVGGLDLSGRKLVNAPKWTGYARAQFTQEVDGIGKFTLGGVANYRSTAYFDSANFYDDPSRWLFSAKATWTSPDEHYFASVSGENLSNKKYNTIKSPQNLGGWRVSGAPRWVYFTVGVKL